MKYYYIVITYYIMDNFDNIEDKHIFDSKLYNDVKKNKGEKIDIDIHDIMNFKKENDDLTFSKENIDDILNFKSLKKKEDDDIKSTVPNYDITSKFKENLENFDDISTVMKDEKKNSNRH